jgi:hypothetical protein
LAGKTKQGAASIVNFGWHISIITQYLAALECTSKILSAVCTASKIFESYGSEVTVDLRYLTDGVTDRQSSQPKETK